MSDLVREYVARFFSMPPYGVAAIILLLLYVLQAEIRFGTKARAMVGGASDRGSTIVLNMALAVPLLGFFSAMKGRMPVTLPAMPAAAWAGVLLGALGLLLRMWAVFVLRDRYTRTLLVQDQHRIASHGPYQFVRHPGYLGSLLCLNGIGLASGNTLTVVASVLVTCAAYAYRIRVEEAMLIEAFGKSYEEYRRSTPALFPWIVRKRPA